MRIGILGGTFDPPHIGHLVIADAVKNTLQLDEVWFIPTNEPPHKEKAMSNKADRLAMLTLALQTNEQFKVNSIELNRSGPSYTIDTISRLQAKYPDAIFYFIIGGDMVESLPSWKKIDELIKRVQFVGVTRAHYSLQSVYNIIRIDIPSIDISSSYIRESIQHERSFRYLLPSDVYHYIKEHKLYGFR